MPPPWASLTTDATLYARSLPLASVAPSVIPLNTDSICRCGAVYNPDLLSTELPCTIFGLSRSYTSRIEQQVCPSSCKTGRRRGISPETRHLGLFNFNGRILLAHDLLDEYTSAYTSSETPFVAWVTVVTRRYEIHSSEGSFLSEEMFRAAWFSYVRLQQLDGDMKCPECGPTPETVIWDGVTLAFSRKHILSSLRPPTTLDIDSATRNACVYRAQQQLLVDINLRKLIRKIINGPPFPSAALAGEDVAEQGGNFPEGTQNDSGAKGDLKSKEASQAVEAAIALIDLIGSAVVQLKAVNQGLAEVFEEHFGFKAYSSRRKVSSVFRELFIQVRAHSSSSCIILNSPATARSVRRSLSSKWRLALLFRTYKLSTEIPHPTMHRCWSQSRSCTTY
jgi:hypothetical protein